MTVSHVSHSKQDQVAEMAKRCAPSQTEVIFVIMDALVRICEDDIIAINRVTATPWPDAFDLSCPNQLAPDRYAHVSGLSYSNRVVIANQNSHAFGLSSSLARQKMRMRMRCSRSKHVSIFEKSNLHLYCSRSSASWLNRFCLWPPISQLTFHESFLKGSSRIVTSMEMCRDRSVGLIPRSLCWGSKTRLD